MAATSASPAGVLLNDVRPHATHFNASPGTNNFKDRIAAHAEGAVRQIQDLITGYPVAQGQERPFVLERAVHSWFDSTDDKGPAGGLVALYQTLLNSLDGKQGMTQAIFASTFMVGKLNDLYQFVAHEDPIVAHANPQAAAFIALTPDQKAEYWNALVTYMDHVIAHGTQPGSGSSDIDTPEEVVDFIGELIRDPEAALQDPLHAVKLVMYLKSVIQTLDPKTTIENIAANANADPLGTFSWLLQKYNNVIQLLPAPIRDKLKHTLQFGLLFPIGIIAQYISSISLNLRIVITVISELIFVAALISDLVHWIKHRNDPPVTVAHLPTGAEAV